MRLRVLFVEDSENDALLVLKELKRIGYKVASERVETEDAMQIALKAQEWDIIISDYTLPSFNAPRALEVLKASGKVLPFIILSGTIGEETAVAVLKSGANDFMLKTNLARLGPVIERELGEAAIRREHRQAQQSLARSEAQLRALFASMQDVVFVLDRSGVYRQIAPTHPGLLSASPEQLQGKSLQEVLPLEQAEEFRRLIKHVLETKTTTRTEYSLNIGNRSVWFDAAISPMEEDSTVWVARDISERKEAEEAIRQHITDLEMLYRSGLSMGRLLSPREIAQELINLMGSKLEWHHTTIRLFHPENESLELLAFQLPDTKSNMSAEEIGGYEELFRTSIVKPGDGLSGWAIQHRQTVRVGDLTQDSRYREIFPGLRSGLYVPLQTEDHLVGVISIESENSDAFSEADEHLASILANQAAVALENARLHQETLRQLRQLEALHAIDQTITGSLDQRITLDALLTHTLSQLNVDAAAILLLQPYGPALEYFIGKGFRTRTIESVSLKLSDTFGGQALVKRQTIQVLDPEALGSRSQINKLWTDEGFKSMFIVPLVSKGKTQGVLGVFQRGAFTADPYWTSFLETLAGQTTIAIDNSQMFNDLQHANMELAVAYDATIEGWSQAMDLRDKETEGHTLRVTEMSIRLAKAMKFSDEEIIHFRRGALLHDIGKLGVPDYILFKPGKLTIEEMEMMKKHPQFAYDMLSPITYLRRSLDIPHYHHEKWDGTGYPQGLKAEQIPLAARIFSVVDVWDAVTSDRPYRKAWNKPDALQYIREQGGAHFDPQVIEAFLNEFANE